MYDKFNDYKNDDNEIDNQDVAINNNRPNNNDNNSTSPDNISNTTNPQGDKAQPDGELNDLYDKLNNYKNDDNEVAIETPKEENKPSDPFYVPTEEKPSQEKPQNNDIAGTVTAESPEGEMPKIEDEPIVVKENPATPSQTPQAQEPEISFEELQEQVKAELRAELAEEIKAELRKELLEEIKAELQAEMKEDEQEIVAEVTQEIEKEELKTLQSIAPATASVDNEIKAEIKKVIIEEYKEELKEAWEEPIKEELKDQVKAEVLEKEKEAIEEKVKEIRKNNVGTPQIKQEVLKEATKTEYIELNQNIEVVPIQVGQVIPMNNIFFDANKSTLKDESFSELERVLEFLKKNDNLVVEVGGHTNALCSSSFANTLSSNRAKEVRAYFVKNGIAENRVEYRGYGKTKQIAENKTLEGRRKNQRVELTILEIK